MPLQILTKAKIRKADSPPVYFLSLTMKDVKCFQGENTIDLSDGAGGWAKWTVILGNNNTGKTTILKCLAGLQSVETEYNFDEHEKDVKTGFLPLGWPFPLNGSVDSKLWLNGSSLNFVAESYEESPNIWKLIANDISNLKPYSFGVNRHMNQNGGFGNDSKFNSQSNLYGNSGLPDCEEWLLSLFASINLLQEKAQIHLNLAQKILLSGLFPDVKGIEFGSREKDSGFENYVQFLTDFGWIRLREMGFGYQAMMAWVLDLVRRMIERYGGEDPLAQPAIVLVDEIDLHLHPDWQRKIIAHLDKYFPKTQFIVTAHSPLIVQSAENVNLVVLKKEDGHVSIEQPKLRNYRGWTVEEILTDIMQLEGKTMSQTYLDWMKQFDEALDNDNFEAAQQAFDELDKILHPSSPQRKLLKLQMTSLEPA